MPCKHAALAAIYAQQMAEMDEPWKLWECREATEKHGNSWTPISVHPAWWENYDYRQITKTISINGFDVPEPMREKPEYHGIYFYIDTDQESSVSKSEWLDDKYDNRRFDKRICHATRENCIIHAKALFSFSEVG